MFLAPGDPIALGLVRSLNRPGDNITGVSFFNTTVGTKRLELLHEMVPQARTFAFLVNPSADTTEVDVQAAHGAARTLDLQLVILRAGDAQHVDAAFTLLRERRADALIVNPDGFLTSRREQILSLLARQPLPSIHSPREWALSGALMSYGTNTADSYRQAGIYAGRILKGEKPSDLPVMQPTRFELVINVKTAKVLGLEVPAKILALADEVIE